MLELGRKALFFLDPETAHAVGMKGLKVLDATGTLRFLSPRPPDLPVTVFNIRFRNPVGLAAGFDKNGEYLSPLGSLGFGFIEAGTVTPRPQPGNAKPRLIRIREHAALINRMGFNNCGIEQFLKNVRASRGPAVVGVNIGKNADTPIERAVDDYLTCMRAAYELADYLVVNVSSPNTVGLRTLQAPVSLAPLLSRLKDEQTALCQKFGFNRPLLVKISPDLTDDDLKDISNVIVECGIDGVVAANTALSRRGIEEHPLAGEAGGLSGEPIRERALQVIRMLKEHLGNNIPIVASGGLSRMEHAQAAILAGASLVQVYTGFVYRGPIVISDLVRGCSVLS